MNGIMKISKFLKYACLLITGLTEIVEIKIKKQKEGFLGMLAATLTASILGNMLPGKGVVRGGYEVVWAGGGTKTAGEGTSRAGQDL